MIDETPPGSAEDSGATDRLAGGKAFIGGRRDSRERAVHLLYEAQIKGLEPAEVIATQVLEPDRFTIELVSGVGAHRDELDSYIERFAKDWTIKRMPVMDVVVLRVALFELLHRSDVPKGAILSEAVELASQYGTDDSARFVNGLLAAAAEEIRSA